MNEPEYSFKPVPEPDKQALADNPKKLVLWKRHKEEFIKWALTMGKNPLNFTGYAHDTVEVTNYNVSAFFRWVWNENGGYTTNVSHEQADEFMVALAFNGESQSYRAKFEKSLKRYFAFLADEKGGTEWVPERHVSEPSHNKPADYLTKEERKAIREAVLDYDTIPEYNNLSPEARDRWKTHLAFKIGKPKHEISPSDWNSEGINSWKYTSLVWTSLDVGLRPVEAKRSRLHWLDLENNRIRIPIEEASKSRDNWECAITTDTAFALSEWLEERETYEKYDGREEIWLTREGNPYASTSLRTLLHNLCDEAGISTTNRKMSWYAIRHSVGTFMHESKGLKAAQMQLRHRSHHTTMKYIHPDLDVIRDGLNEMG
jgi:site-specific recombinase XerD